MKYFLTRVWLAPLGVALGALTVLAFELSLLAGIGALFLLAIIWYGVWRFDQSVRPRRDE